MDQPKYVFFTRVYCNTHDHFNQPILSISLAMDIYLLKKSEMHVSSFGVRLVSVYWYMDQPKDVFFTRVYFNTHDHFVFITK